MLTRLGPQALQRNSVSKAHASNHKHKALAKRPRSASVPKVPRRLPNRRTLPQIGNPISQARTPIGKFPPRSENQTASIRLSLRGVRWSAPLLSRGARAACAPNRPPCRQPEHKGFAKRKRTASAPNAPIQHPSRKTLLQIGNFTSPRKDPNLRPMPQESTPVGKRYSRSENSPAQERTPIGKSPPRSEICTASIRLRPW